VEIADAVLRQQKKQRRLRYRKQERLTTKKAPHFSGKSEDEALKTRVMNGVAHQLNLNIRKVWIEFKNRSLFLIYQL